MIEIIRQLVKTDISKMKRFDKFKIKDKVFTIEKDELGISYPIFCVSGFEIYLYKNEISIKDYNDHVVTIPVEELEQDDSYLILKYGRILTKGVQT